MTKREALDLAIEVVLDDLADLSGWRVGGFRENFKRKARPVIERLLQRESQIMLCDGESERAAPKED
jgi:hypothetical protein